MYADIYNYWIIVPDNFSFHKEGYPVVKNIFDLIAKFSENDKI